MKAETLKKIRAAVLGREGVRRVRITRAGEVHAWGDMQRGDGGKTPWWMFAGMVADLSREID